MAYFLIDYENTKKAGMKGIEQLTDQDRVCLFYSQNADTLTFDMHRKINECRAKWTFIDVNVGTKNALDFQLVTYLGYLIGQNKQEKYCIVSQDKGFGSVCTFWQGRKVNVLQTQDLRGRNVEQEQKAMVQAIQDAVGDWDVARQIAAIIQKYKTKQGINNALMREFPSAGNKVSGEYYKLIKPLLKDKKGN